MKHINTYHDFVNESVSERVSAGLAILYDGKVLLAHTSGRKFTTGYGIPKGGVEVGESLTAAAIRETAEEIGVKVPASLVDKTEHKFTVNGKKWGYFKTVYWFVVKIDNLAQIGMKEEKVPKSQLQIEEINDARFMGLTQAKEVIMPSQLEMLNTLVNLGLLS